MLNVILENPAQTVEIARTVLAVTASIFFVGVAAWAVNGIRNS